MNKKISILHDLLKDFKYLSLKLNKNRNICQRYYLLINIGGFKNV